MPNPLLNEMLSDAVIQRDHTAALVLLQQGADPNHSSGYPLRPLLILAAELRDLRMAKLLLMWGGNPNTSYEHYTLLSYCIDSAFPELVKVALQEEADLTKSFDDYENALTWAVENGDIISGKILIQEIFKISIIKYYKTNCRDGRSIKYNKNPLMEEVYEVSGMRGEILKAMSELLYTFVDPIVRQLPLEFDKKDKKMLLGLFNIIQNIKRLYGKEAQSILLSSKLQVSIEEIMMVGITVFTHNHPVFQNYQESIRLLNNVNIEKYEQLYQNWLLLPQHYDALSLMTPLTERVKETIIAYLEDMPLNDHFKFMITEWMPLPKMCRVVSDATKFSSGPTSIVVEYATDNLPLASTQTALLFGYGSKQAALCEIKDDEPEKKSNVNPVAPRQM